MKAAFVALFAAGVVSAQDLSSVLPECAAKCITAAIPKTDCKADDAACLCKEMSTIQMEALPCLTKDCSTDELLKAQKAAASQCENPDAGTTGSMTIMPTDKIVTPPAPTETPMVTPPPHHGGNSSTTTIPGGNGGSGGSNGGSGGNGDSGNGNGGSGNGSGGNGGSSEGGDNSTGAAPMQTAGALIAMLAAVAAL